MRRTGVGMAKAVRRIDLADNASPRLRKDGRVRLVATRHAGKHVFSVALDVRQDCLRGLWQWSNGGACLCLAKPQASILYIDFGPFEVEDFGAATTGECEQS